MSGRGRLRRRLRADATPEHHDAEDERDAEADELQNGQASSRSSTHAKTVS